MPSRVFAAPDPNADAIVSGLKGLASVLNGLGAFEELGKIIPLTALDPSADNALNLDYLFGGVFSGLSSSSVAGLQGAIEGLSGTYSGVTVVFGSVNVSENGDFADLSFAMNGSRTINTPIAFSQDSVNLAGGGLPVELGFSTTLTFQLDKNKVDTASNVTAFYLVGEPTINFAIAIDASPISSFASLLGFAEVQAGGSATMNMDILVDFADPDEDGVITVEEWSTTSLVDLVGVNYTSGSAVNFTLTLDTDLIPGSPDATISLEDSDLRNGLNPATTELGSLSDFTNIQPAEVLGGFNQMAAALLGGQTIGDLPLPFLQESLGDTFAFAQPLVDFLKAEGEAAIVCGTEDTDPPTGSVWNLPAGTIVYCQAITLENPDSVNWTITNGAVVSGGNSTDTVGTNPTENAAFNLTAGGCPDVTVAFTFPSDGQTHVVTRLFRSAQEMGEKLVEIAGFDETLAIPIYDPATHTLRYRLQKSMDPAAVNGTLNFGSQLQAATNLTGLGPGTGADVKIDSSNVTLNVTFGIILVDDPNSILPGANVSDRFFLQVNPDEPEFQADASLIVNNVALEGRLAFLQVEAVGDAEPTGTIFSIGRSDGSKPMLGLDFDAPGINVTDNPAITNAILVTQLLNELSDRIAPSYNVKVSAGLKVSAFVENHTVELASGKVGIDWPNVFNATCGLDTEGLNITTDTDFIENLKAFDIDPDNYMALLSIILDNLDELVTGLDTLPEGSYLDTKLPVVGTSPRDLISQFDTLQDIIDYVRTHPPYSLQELEEMLEDQLGLDPDVLKLELADLESPGDGIKELVIRLDYGICTGNNTVIDPCEDGDKVVDKLEKRINLDLGDDLPGLVGLEPNPSFQLEYAARAQLDLGIPLCVACNAFVVVDSTGVEVQVGVGATAINLSANAGPLTLNVGKDVFIVSGNHTGGDAQNLTDSSTNFTDLNVPVGATLKNTTTNTTGTVTAVSNHTLNWDAGNWTDGDEYEVYGVGLAMMGANFTLRNNSTSDILSINDFLLGGDLTAELDGIDCDCGTADGPGLEGDACASLSVGLDNPGYLGTINLVVSNLTDPATYNITVPEDLVSQIGGAALDWSLWLNALPDLLEKVEHILNGGSDISLPLVGGVLDAGADVVGTINDDLVTPLVDRVGELEGLATVGNLSEEIQTQIFEAIGDDPGGADLLGDANGDGNLTKEDITVTCRNETGICAASANVTEIDDIQITFYIGQDFINAETPFKIGLPGLPLGAQGSVAAEVGWKLLVDFGLSRSEGPYIVTGGANHTDAELQLGAAVGLGDAPAACSCDPDDPGDPSGLQGYSTTRCLEGHLGFLQVTLRDGADDYGSTSSLDDDASKLELTASLNLSCDSGERLTLAQLVAGSAGLDLDVGADANIDMRFRTGIRSGQTAGFPSVLGTFHLSWNWSTDDPELSAPEIQFKNLYLNSGTFIGQLLKPAVEGIKGVTSPLQPVIDTIRAPVPVLTQLAELVGQSPVTMLSLLEAASGSDLTLLYSLLDFIDFANNLPIGDKTVWIPLGPQGSGRQPGNFTVDAGLAQAGPLTPDQAGSLVKTASAGSNLLEEVGGANPSGTSERPRTFGVDGLSFPFMKDAKNIFALLMGQDVVLVHYDTGIMRASAGVKYDFGPIMVGPIPIHISIGGSIAVEGRFAIGYDTTGLRKLLGGEGTGTDLLDGIYIDDLNAQGIDVPEVKFTGTVAASAGIDLLIVSAGVQGGIRLTVGLNLNDSPNPDGKLRIEEIVTKLDNPICLFDVQGSLEAFLRAYVKIGFWIFSKTFRFTIVKVTLLDFCAGCSPPRPVLAKQVGGTLYLHIGTNASKRNIHTGETNEKFVVRQLTHNVSGSAPGKFSVTAFGVHQVFDGVTDIYANAHTGNDVISLEPGTDSNNITVPFTAPSLIYGGAGNDQLRGGSGKDELHGGIGNDVICGGGDDDKIWGDGGDDVLSGDNGNDQIDGGDGNDAITGGPGGDTLKGGAGDDELSGGPGTDANPDLADTIEGGPGNDNIEGNDGNDFLYGDEVLSCSAAGAGSGGDDQIQGGSGNDTIRGGAGDDLLIGEEGDDEICGNSGEDFIDGDDDDASTDDGNDVLYGGAHDDEMHGRGGSDYMEGNADADTMYGDAGQDEMYGNSGNDTMWGGIDDDYMEGNEDNDTMHGDAGQDEMYGNENNDTMYGDADEDVMYGNAGDDTMWGGIDDDYMEGNEDNDTMYGDSGNDEMYGSTGDDTMRGGIGDDYMEGNQDVDTMYGDAGQDDMIGGSSIAGTPDTGDIMRGNAQQDVMCGDNAQITRPGGTNSTDSADGTVIRTVTLLNLNLPIGGNDTMYGDAGNDDMYGGPEADTMHGNAGDDYMEGNPGSEIHMYGDAGQDDMMGGTSQTGSTYPDGGDIISGGDGAGGVTDSDYDVILGDNGNITRVKNTTTGMWLVNSFNNAVTRNITLYDVAEFGSPSPAGNSSGNDTLYGEANDDIMYGQGGNDEMYGGSGDDYMEGNADGDTMEGNAGQDDMVGGTGRINDDPPQGVDGRYDGNDIMYGENATSGNGTAEGDGADVMLGDNAIISRPVNATGQWTINTFNGAVTRVVWLRDVATMTYDPIPEASGNDTMWGNDNDDIMYGQGDEDEMHGGAGDDYMEGNAASDEMYGDPEDDDMIGGTGLINDDPPEGTPGRIDASTQTREVTLGNSTVPVPLGDTMYGGDGSDVMLGDNAIVTRPLYEGGWITLEYSLFVSSDGTSPPRHETSGNGSRIDREVYTVDREPGPGLVAGSDLMYGGPGDDDIYGQLDDSMIEGGPVAIGDEMYGEEGEDAMAGDQGLFENWVVETPTQHIEPKEPFIDDDVFVYGTLFRQLKIEEDQIDLGGDDRMLGGDDGDWMHGGAGNDLMNGNSGNDRLFGDNGDDAMWGGYHHDHLWGGWGNDYLDVKPRDEMTVGKGKKQETIPADPDEWFEYTEFDNYQDIDYIYGGWNRDAMQANIADEGPVPGDRLIDWVGAYNVYYLCPGVYGEFVSTRDHSPHMIKFLQELAEGDGALDPANEASSGFVEVAIVFPKEGGQNAHPPHPDNVGHFTCN